jgi:hypothetical protein
MTVFDNPPHETRYAYGTIREGNGIIQHEVIEVTYLPTAKKRPVTKSVASEEFLHNMQQQGFAIPKPVGTLVNAGYGRWGQRNDCAIEMIGSSWSLGHRMGGPFYWLDMAPSTEMWWRWSVPLDFKKMPGVKAGKGGNRQDYMRIAIAEQIQEQLSTGPFFVETIWNMRDKRRYWFDIYARKEIDLVAFKLLLG